MKGQCFNLPTDNLHVLLTQNLLEGSDCGLYMFICVYIYIYIYIYICVCVFTCLCLHPLSVQQPSSVEIFSMERGLASRKTRNLEDQGLYQVCSPRQVAFTMALDRICNTRCFYPATMVTQTCLNSILYVPVPVIFNFFLLFGAFPYLILVNELVLQSMVRYLNENDSSL